jgi:cytochrome c551/c552
MSGTSFVAMWEGTPASVEDGRGEQLLPGHSKQLFYLSGGLKTIMKKAMFILLAVMFAIGMAAAQDVLGPHNVNGHGCVSCHAPHSGPAGLDPTSANAAQGDVYLWGRNLVAKTYNLFGSTTAAPLTMTIPAAITDENDPLFHSAACLSCHDGSVTVAGMTGKSLEDVDGKAGISTYLGTDDLKNDHPVHVAYTASSYNWPVTIDANGTLTWGTDTNSTNFKNSYGRTVRFYGNAATHAAMVECTTCHNPHLEAAYKGTIKGVASTVVPSKWFIRGWYNEAPGSNSTTQFCRQCHFSKSNEYVGQTVPTT